MKTDLYTKTILTIIAICLVWICISMTASAFADRDVVDVNIVKVSDTYIGNAVPVVQKWPHPNNYAGHAAQRPFQWGTGYQI
jgi:hypothetical protein